MNREAVEEVIASMVEVGFIDVKGAIPEEERFEEIVEITLEEMIKRRNQDIKEELGKFSTYIWDIGRIKGEDGVEREATAEDKLEIICGAWEHLEEFLYTALDLK